MRKIWVTLYLLAIATMVYGAVVDAQYNKVRVSGAVTPNTDVYYIAQDSSDSFNVDTTYSDTITIFNYKYLNIAVAMTGYNLADSANDSVLAIIQGYGMYNGKFATLLYTDTLPTTLGALDSTDVQLQTFRIDTVGFNQFYFRTIFKDSFVSDEVPGGDSTRIAMEYRVLQSGSR